jgi:hypothetical protein
MKCEIALERMLEAEPAVLRGEDVGELAEHVAGCARCARIAATLLEETDTVDRALGEWAGSASADSAADTALAAVRAAGREGVVSPRGDRDPGTAAAARAPRQTWVRRAWIPLAAAAALAGVLVTARNETPFPKATESAGTPFEPRVSVTPPADRSAAIMETENPNITIVWLYEREGS